MHFLSLSSLRRSLKRTALAACFAFALPTFVFAQAAQGAAQQPPQLTDRVSEELGKMRPHLDAQAWDQAIAIVNNALPGVPAGSYDEAVLSQMKAQILLQKGDYKNSIPALERTVQLGETHSNYFDKRVLLEYTYYLSQLYYQEATTLKGIDAQRPLMQKAITYIKRYLETSPSPNQDARLFAASVLFAMGQLDPDNINQAMIKEAYDESQKGLRMAVNPNDRFYLLSLAALQLLGRMQDSAELLELLITKEPKNATYWQQLAATYLNLSGETKDERQAYELQVRAILTIQRAQQNGVMNTPRDNFSLVGIYFNIQQFDRAIGLLEKGLRDGGIENTQRNWELLASSYQQLKREFKAIEALKEGMNHFPNAGGLDLQVANIYYSLDNHREALNFALSALKKGNLDSPSQAQSFGAWVAFELKEFEVALNLAQEAAKDPKNRDANRLLDHIKNTVEERNQSLQNN